MSEPFYHVYDLVTQYVTHTELIVICLVSKTKSMMQQVPTIESTVNPHHFELKGTKKHEFEL